MDNAKDDDAEAENGKACAKDDMGPALASQQKLAKVEVDINQPNPHHPTERVRDKNLDE